MRRMFIRTLPFLLCAAVAMPAFAGWEYPGEYLGDGYYTDNGARFVLSARGGASYGFGTIENDLGATTVEYSLPEGSEYPQYCTEGNCPDSIGFGDFGALPPGKDLSQFSFAAGASIGFTVPYRPQWRMELGWDHITEADYNASPLFKGDLHLTSGYVISDAAGAISSKISTDVISAMAFYDFFDGISKPMNTFIPYIGAGIGYARTKTTTNLSDPYDNLSADIDLRDFGYESGYGDIINFYRSETETGNFAALAALGVSYGIMDGFFIDFGARVMYIPRVKWTLVNEDNTRHRDLISAKNLIYGNVTLGVRFEF